MFLDLTLYPHRSLSKRGFYIVMAAVALVSVSVSMGFFAMGAWPIPGFLGLDILIVYFAFRASYRRARGFEHLTLDKSAMRVRRKSWQGEERSWDLEPTWLNVQLSEPVDHDSSLTLRSKDTQLTIGAFLPPHERLEVAKAIRAAIEKRRDSLAQPQVS